MTRSPVLSNISIDGSIKNDRPTQNVMEDWRLPVRDRSMSSNTQSNASLYSGKGSIQSRGCSSTSSLGASSLAGSTMSLEERKQKVIRYWEKKKQRMNKNHVRYHCRKDLAENRFRYHGRFISKEQMEKIMNAEGGKDEIYNPSMKCTPKTK